MQRILACLDGSPRSEGVLATAVLVARASGGKIVLLRSVGLPPEVPQDFWKTTDEPLLDVLTKRAREYLASHAAALPAGVLDRSEVTCGVPWQAICEAAERDAVDLVVLGSHGYSGLDHVLGTTAAKVVNHAKCSVLVVRPSAAAGKA